VALRATLALKLRPHQLAGIKFVYECLSGMRPDGTGCILADEMGLGKTLTTLAALRVLCRAALTVNDKETERTKVRKAAIICPATLVTQWPAEDKKWFGAVSSNVTFVAASESPGKGESLKDAIARWAAMDGRHTCAVLSVSYESFARHAEQITGDAQLDLLVMDEGHRLKSGSGVVVAAIQHCRAAKRLLLTGTPCMNNLDEFHALATIVNPGCLGDRADFRRDVVAKATAGALRGASRADRESRRAALRGLRRRVSTFFLRRTAADIDRKDLPPKTEHFVCCAMTASQRCAYVSACARRDESEPLAAIRALSEMATRGVCVEGGNDSGKLAVLDALLEAVRQRGERAVVVSTSTATLDVVASRCAARDWATARLDGATPTSDRRGIVDGFNRGGGNAAFVFLLSARAGGAGINLVGASHLVVVDPDWNPATDEQAMARVWRDGQKKPVHIYRLFSAATIDEKIYQRQLSKHDLADGVVDEQQSRGHFRGRELAALFEYDVTSLSSTFDLLSKSSHAVEWPAYGGTESIVADDDALRTAAQACRRRLSQSLCDAARERFQRFENARRANAGNGPRDVRPLARDARGRQAQGAAGRRRREQRSELRRRRRPRRRARRRRRGRGRGRRRRLARRRLCDAAACAVRGRRVDGRGGLSPAPRRVGPRMDPRGPVGAGSRPVGAGGRPGRARRRGRRGCRRRPAGTRGNRAPAPPSHRRRRRRRRMKMRERKLRGTPAVYL